MNPYKIITDSSCDLPADLAKELELEVAALSIEMEGKSFYNYLDGREISVKEFYDKLRAGIMAKTSAVSAGEFVDAAEPFLQAGEDVLFMSFSSGLSATCNSACIARDTLKEKYPERKIYVVDTLCASLGQGMLIYYAAKKRQAGEDIDTVRAWAEDQKLHLCHWVTVDDLKHLKRGGRISATTAAVGTVLGIKPIIHMDDAGRLTNVGKARGRQAALKTLVNKMAETAINPAEQTFFICHGDCLEDAEKLAEMVRAEIGAKECIINPVGPVIGAHTGPGVVALFFFGEKR